MRFAILLCVAATLIFGDTIDFSALLLRLNGHPSVVSAKQSVIAEKELITDRGVSIPRILAMSSVDGSEQQILVEQMIPRASELRATTEMRQSRATAAETSNLQRQTAVAVELRKLLIALDKEQKSEKIYAEQEKLFHTMIGLMKIRSELMDESASITMTVLDSQMVAQKRITSQFLQKSYRSQIEQITGPLSENPILGELWQQENRPMPTSDSSLMVIMAGNETAMSHADLSMAKSGLRPDFMGMVQVERKAMGMEPKPMWQLPMVGVSVTLPVAISRQKSRIRGAEATVSSRVEEQESVRRSVNATLAEAYESEQKAIMVKMNYRITLIPQSDRLIAIQLQRYQNSDGDVPSILMAIRQKQELQLMEIEESSMAEMSALMIEEMSCGSRLKIQSK